MLLYCNCSETAGVGPLMFMFLFLFLFASRNKMVEYLTDWVMGTSNQAADDDVKCLTRYSPSDLVQTSVAPHCSDQRQRPHVTIRIMRINTVLSDLEHVCILYGYLCGISIGELYGFCKNLDN